ncbi:ferredoxin reductase [Lysobacter brunescens]|uniref:Ferredoxin reductase n=1 Tax=Lysobacter brunescens TaxID=262323 RepID=A0ABW2Y7W9_9GAMM
MPPSSASMLGRAWTALVPDHVFDFWAERVSPTWSRRRPLARIVGREDTAADTVTLVLAGNRHVRRPAPGQHVMVGAEVDGRRVARSYSPSLLPGGRLAITVKAVPGGRLSEHLVHHARVGDVLTIGEPFGSLTLPDDAAPVLLLAGGSGITPLIALLRDQALRDRGARGSTRPITLAYWVRTPGEACFVEELRALADAHPALRVHIATTRATDPRFAHGRLDADTLATLAGEGAAPHVLACGSAGFVAHARALAEPRAASFQAEAFSPPDALPGETGEAEVRLARSGTTLRVPRNQPLLVALEAAGLRPAHGCRMGICNTCACGKSAGTTRDVLTGARDPEPATALRLCISAAAGDLVLDL